MVSPRNYFSNPVLNATPAGQAEEQTRILQEAQLQRQIKYCYDNSDFYREKLDQVGAAPQDIVTMDDLRALPVLMNKDDERRSAEESLASRGHPFGRHLCAPVEELFLTGTTSGTTGMPTFTYTFTYNDVQTMSRGLGHRLAFNGVGKGDRVLFIFALGIYATTMTLWGIRGLGALPIDVDARAGSDLMLRFGDLARPDYLMCTPSLASHLVDRAPDIIGKQVGDMGFKGVMFTGEVGVSIPEVKKELEEQYGCRAYDYWAPAGHCIAITCDSDEYHGMHATSPDLCTSFHDLVDPDTKEPVAIEDGAVGEMVITSLKREAAPLLKYGYGDIVQIFTEPCPACGFPGRRIKLIGRSDDMLIVKGVNIYPSAIKEIISSFAPQVTGQLRIILEEPPPRVVPPLKIKLEHGEGTGLDELEGLGQAISGALHDQLKIRPLFQWVAPGTLEKSTRKTQVFEKAYK
jgi:phenylacetate-CoA ligase